MRAVIFDFDGVILDSEPQHEESFVRLFAAHGVSFSETPQEFTGVGARDNIRRVYAKAGVALSDEEVEKLNSERDAFYLDIISKNARALSGAVKLVLAVKAAGFKIALASSTNSSVIDLLLPKIGLKGAFDVVVGGDQVQRGKPDPEIFLLAAKSLGVVASQCVVVEDSNAGVRAAKAAGMKVLMVRNDRILQEKDVADCFVDSLVKVTPQTLSVL